jgi:hypothetical protein
MNRYSLLNTAPKLMMSRRFMNKIVRNKVKLFLYLFYSWSLFCLTNKKKRLKKKNQLNIQHLNILIFSTVHRLAWNGTRLGWLC